MPADADNRFAGLAFVEIAERDLGMAMLHRIYSVRVDNREQGQQKDGSDSSGTKGTVLWPFGSRFSPGFRLAAPG